MQRNLRTAHLHGANSWQAKVLKRPATFHRSHSAECRARASQSSDLSNRTVQLRPDAHFLFQLKHLPPSLRGPMFQNSCCASALTAMASHMFRAFFVAGHDLIESQMHGLLCHVHAAKHLNPAKEVCSTSERNDAPVQDRQFELHTVPLNEGLGSLYLLRNVGMSPHAPTIELGTG